MNELDESLVYKRRVETIVVFGETISVQAHVTVVIFRIRTVAWHPRLTATDSYLRVLNVFIVTNVPTHTRFLQTCVRRDIRI